MKKVLMILIYSGLIIFVAIAIFSIAGFGHSHNLEFGIHVLLFVSVTAWPLLRENRRKKFNVNTLFCLGASLLFLSMILKDFRVHTHNYLALAGLSLFLAGLIFVAYVNVAAVTKSKMIKGYIDAPEITLPLAELDTFIGTYCTDKEFPGIKMPSQIVIARGEGCLTGQATGQNAFPLQAIGANIFKYERAGIVMVFDTLHKQMKFMQHGREYPFVKEI